LSDLDIASGVLNVIGFARLVQPVSHEDQQLVHTLQQSQTSLRLQVSQKVHVGVSVDEAATIGDTPSFARTADRCNFGLLDGTFVVTGSSVVFCMKTSCFEKSSGWLVTRIRRTQH
jgi:hypothetical protein